MGDDGPAVRGRRPDRGAAVAGKDRRSLTWRTGGRIQVYFRRITWATRYDVVELLDLDDHVGVQGTLFRTRTGEITVGSRGDAAGQVAAAAAARQDPGRTATAS